MISPTKARLLEASEKILLAKGFHGVGLREILDAVKVPKGSFYHHFESKEQFGVELLSHYVEAHTERLRKVFAGSGRTELEAFDEFWSYQIGLVTVEDCRQCCLLTKLSLEVANFSEPMREVMARALATWRSIYADAVRAGQADGSIRRDLDPDEIAEIIQDTWQGALLRVAVEKKPGALRTAARFLHGTLASPP